MTRYQIITHNIDNSCLMKYKYAGILGQHALWYRTLEPRPERIPGQLWRKKGTGCQDRADGRIPDPSRGAGVRNYLRNKTNRSVRKILPQQQRK